MFPHEAQAMMAKMIFIIFAMLILVFGKAPKAFVEAPVSAINHVLVSTN